MGQFKFDVFLCHNSQDKTAVIEIAQQLKLTQIKPWLDDWELQPGLPWQPELEKQIPNIKSAAVFIGQSGIGPWQEEEINSFLREFHRRKCPVIPILLPNAPQKPKLPLFLEGRTWVDFRTGSTVHTDPWKKLVWGITGIRPESQPVVQTQQPQISSLPQKIWLLSDFSSEKGIDDLGSEKGVDYTRLRDLLKAGNWKDADYETYLVMLKAVAREEGDWIRTEELLKFPCTDLRTIDKLWIKHSNGQFGFSVQKQIYLSVGGIADGRYYKETWEKFGDKVGWRMSEEWITYDKVIFSTFTKKGHLPSECGLVVGEDNGMEALLLRLVNCNI
jgi:hypothetical protein